MPLAIGRLLVLTVEGARQPHGGVDVRGRVRYLLRGGGDVLSLARGEVQAGQGAVRAEVSVWDVRACEA